jgi:hypothetical protein
VENSKIGALGNALSGMGAGFTGQGPQWQNAQTLDRKQRAEMSEQDRQQRRQAFYGDVVRGKQMAAAGDWGAVNELMVSRMDSLMQLGDADQTDDTRRLVSLAQIASSGGPKAKEAGERFMSTADGYLDLGVQLGHLKAPAKATAPTNFKVNQRGEMTAFANGQQGVVPSGDSRYKQPGAVVEVNTGVDGDQNKKWNEMLVANYQEIHADAKNARQQNIRLNSLKNLDVETGLGVDSRAGLAKFANALMPGSGDVFMDENQIPGVEVYKALSEQLTNSELMNAKGVQTDGDAKRVRATMASIGKTNLANSFLVNTMQEYNRRMIERDDYYRKYRRDNGRDLEGADDAWMNHIETTPMIGSITDKATGLPLLYSDFMKRAKKQKPKATRQQLVTDWRTLNGVGG